MVTLEPSLNSAVTNDRSTWPYVKDHYHFGISKYVPGAASGMMNANSGCLHFKKLSQR